MASWYLVKIRFQKEDEAGSLKTINEAYLFDAISYTEAEAKGYKKITTGASDFSVSAITKMRLADLFTYEDGEKWFKAKVVYYSVDEKSGKEKKVVNYMLVNADGIDQALQRITESLRTMLVPYETTDLNLTQILDVFAHSSEDEEAEIPANLRPLSEVMAERESNQQRESDGKRRVFKVTPYSPYDIGDFWISNQVILKAYQSRKEGEQFYDTDWSVIDIPEATELTDKQAEAVLKADKTFFDQPVPPYKKGDIWVSGGLRAICNESREEDEVFNQDDWDFEF